ncbi:MerR family transcriptional regulator [Vreelandella olivaria]|uniref:MerR family transcriptional regulator n=1 Tax=Vreelandella olivaria TaxID=390919 RepID=UPI0024C2AC59|nr:MerR family transcriptional regulator [Halomonas olivaria]
MRIGELSKRTGVSIRMLRYYETQGLLKPKRTRSGYRDYAQDEVQTVERIKLLGSTGMTLATIQQFLPCVRGETPVLEPCDELRNVLHEQIRLAELKALKLAKSRDILERFLYEIEQESPLTGK